MEYIGESIWKFVFESEIPFWIRGLFLLCLLVIILTIVFWINWVAAVGKRLGGKS